jgi:putative endonuclease
VYYVYLLLLANQKIYTGYSSQLQQRIVAHKKGLVSPTKKLLPIELIFYAAFKSKKKALDFEKYLKTNSGFAFRNKRLI